MEQKYVFGVIWLLWAIIMYVIDRVSGVAAKDISPWIYVAVICSTIWVAA